MKRGDVGGFLALGVSGLGVSGLEGDLDCLNIFCGVSAFVGDVGAEGDLDCLNILCDGGSDFVGDVGAEDEMDLADNDSEKDAVGAFLGNTGWALLSLWRIS